MEPLTLEEIREVLDPFAKEHPAMNWVRIVIDSLGTKIIHVCSGACETEEMSIPKDAVIPSNYYWYKLNKLVSNDPIFKNRKGITLVYP